MSLWLSQVVDQELLSYLKTQLELGSICKLTGVVVGRALSPLSQGLLHRALPQHDTLLPPGQNLERMPS